MSRRRSSSFTGSSYVARDAVLKLSEADAHVVLRVADSLSGIRGRLASLPPRRAPFANKFGRGLTGRPRANRASSLETTTELDGPVLLSYSGAAYLGVNTISVRERDLESLHDGNMLNDVAVNVALRMWWADMTAQCARLVHVLPSYFFEKLRCHGAESVRKWYPRNLLDKKYLIIPIHEGAHWYLAIALLRPRLQIFTLDSLGSTNRHVAPLIHAFLSCAAAGSDYVVSPLQEDTHMAVKVPKQTGYIDCGVYMLHLARTVLNDPSQWVKNMVRRAGDVTIWGPIYPSDLRLELIARFESLL